MVGFEFNRDWLEQHLNGLGCAGTQRQHPCIAHRHQRRLSVSQSKRLAWPHTMRSPREGSLPNTTTGSGGVGVRSAGGRMRKQATKASTVAGPRKNMRAATAASTMQVPSVALGSCHDSSAWSGRGGDSRWVGGGWGGKHTETAAAVAGLASRAGLAGLAGQGRAGQAGQAGQGT